MVCAMEGYCDPDKCDECGNWKWCMFGSVGQECTDCGFCDEVE